MGAAEARDGRLRERLARLSFKLTQAQAIPLGGGVATFLNGVPDFPAIPFEMARGASIPLYRYPAGFEEVQVPGAGGLALPGILGMQEASEPLPALLILHGMFRNRAHLLIRETALRAFRQWRFHVLAIDLRGHGDLAPPQSDAATTLGILESRDALEAARWLRRDRRVSSVAALGFSLGAATALRAACREGARELLSGGVVALSPFADARAIVEDVGSAEGTLDPRRLAREFFGLVFRLQGERFGLDPFPRTLKEAVERVSIARSDLTPDEFYRQASPALWLDRLETPALVVHAEDDPIIPVAHARRLREAGAGASAPFAVCELPRGGHCAFSWVYPGFMDDACLAFYEAVQAA